MGFPGPEHFVFIPGVLFLGIVIGWIMGGRAARDQIEKKRARTRE
jgi:hypothetical protein